MIQRYDREIEHFSKEYHDTYVRTFQGLCDYLSLFGLVASIEMVQSRRQELLSKIPNNEEMHGRVAAYTDFLERHKTTPKE